MKTNLITSLCYFTEIRYRLIQSGFLGIFSSTKAQGTWDLQQLTKRYL